MASAYAGNDVSTDLTTQINADVTYSELANDAKINPNNQRGLARWNANVSLRPDFEAKNRHGLLVFRPRINLDWSRVEGARSSNAKRVDTYIAELFTRLRLAPNLHLIGGRERLLWGPAYLLSPSNPFATENGREDPSRDLIGQDFARLLWIADSHLSISAIALLEDDNEKTDRSAQRYALKFDYTGFGWSSSVIPWMQESTDEKGVGYYLNWHASDATMLYLEGMSGFGADESFRGLAGITYTFLNGAHVALEMYHQDAGCTVDDIVVCAIRSLNPAFERPSNLFRRNYALLQLVEGDWLDWLDLTLRVSYGLDDNSSRFTVLGNKSMGDRADLYFITNTAIGSPNGEFGQFYDLNLRIGIRIFL